MSTMPKPRPTAAKRAYAATMLFIVGRGMAAASQVDKDMQRDVGNLPDGFTFELTIQPNGPGMVVQKDANGHLRHLGSALRRGKPDLSVQFKSLDHALLVLAFIESTATANAHDRMVVLGDLTCAMPMTRCLERVQAYLLPKPIARLAVKEYPDLTLEQRIRHRIRIFSRLLVSN